MTQPTVVQAEATRFSDLFFSARFEVPWHQRYYDWGPSEVGDLLEDLQEAVEAKSGCYFLGAVILAGNGNGVWEINDGQQRMVTVSLVSAAFCKRFARADNDPQREAIALRLLFDLEANRPCCLADADEYTRRLRPPRNDSAAYRQMIRGRTIGTNGKLTAAWQRIEEFVDGLDLEASRDYFDYLIQRLEVACLRIPPEVDANAVYETINSRGKTLDDLDRLRNHLYSYFGGNSDEEGKEAIHEHLERVRTLFPRGKVAGEYLRCRLQCRWGFLRGSHFYRDARARLADRCSSLTAEAREQGGNSARYVSGLVEDVCSPAAAELFRMMTATNPDPGFVSVFDAAAGTVTSPRGLSVLLRELRSYKVTRPLVFALLDRFVRETDGRRRRRIAKAVKKNLHRLSAFVLRTAFVRQRFAPSEFEKKFADYAREIVAATDVADLAFTEFLDGCDGWGVLDDAHFIEALQNARMKRGRLARQLLSGVNRAEQDDSPLLNEEKTTLEHVLPSAAQHWPTWNGFRGVDCTDWVHRVGNLTLMGPTDNRAGANFNRSFQDKIGSYQRSSVAITRALAEHREWTPEVVEQRQDQIARQAAAVWAFP